MGGLFFFLSAFHSFLCAYLPLCIYLFANFFFRFIYSLYFCSKVLKWT